MTRLLPATVIALSVAMAAQEAPAPLRFEAASLKVNRTPIGSGPIGFSMPPGRFQAVGVPLQILLLTAYGMNGTDEQLVGVPEWATQERYDLIATTGGPRSQQEVTAMLKGLLEERFRIVAHKETRDARVFHLLLARDDGRVGRDLRPSTQDCDAYNRKLAEARAAEAKKASAAGQVPAPYVVSSTQPCSPVGMIPFGRGMTITLDGISMATLAGRLRPYAGGRVIDRTGLQGQWDGALRFMPDYGAMARATGRPTLFVPLNAGGSAALDDAPPLEAALREQLGLKLEKQPGTIEVLVIDRIERPSDDP